MATKFFEIKGEDWMKGLSISPAHAVGGVFESAANFDPYEKPGVLQPSLVSVRKGTSEVVTDINCIVTFQDSGTPYAYAFSNRSAGGIGAYKINLSTHGVTDVSSSFWTAYGSSTVTKAAAIFQSRVVYGAQTGAIYSTTLAGGSDTLIENSVANDVLQFHLAADKYMYYVDGSSNVGRIVDASSASGSNIQNAFALDSSVGGRSLSSDGRYLVIGADNNSNKTEGTKSICQVYFWDLASTTADAIWPIDDSAINALAFNDGMVYVFGNNGLYVCSVNNPPVRILSFKGNSTITLKPITPYQVTAGNGSVFWISGNTSASGGKIFAYGSPIQGLPKRFYQPYTAFSDIETPTALTFCGDSFYAANDASKLYALNTGSTRTSADILTTSVNLPQPFSFEYAKVTLEDAIVSGDSITFGMKTADEAKIISNPETKTFSTDPGKISIIFRNQSTGANQVTRFEDFQMSLSSNTVVRKIELFGTPSESHVQI